MRLDQADVAPKVIRKIHNNRFGSTADNNPLEGDVAGRVDLLVRKPRRNVKKISCLQRGVELPLLAPANVRGSAKNIGNRMLLSMVMDCCARLRFDAEQAAPHRRFNARSRMD